MGVYPQRNDDDNLSSDNDAHRTSPGTSLQALQAVLSVLSYVAGLRISLLVQVWLQPLANRLKRPTSPVSVLLKYMHQSLPSCCMQIYEYWKIQ